MVAPNYAKRRSNLAKDIGLGTRRRIDQGQRIVAAFRDQDFAAAQRWCGVAGAAFLTPYAYLFLAGHAEMPAYATVALATLVAVMAAASILRVRQQCVGCDPLPAVELAFADEV